MFTDYICQRQNLQKGDFYFPLSLHFVSSWPLSASPKYFFPLKPRGSLWKQQRGRFSVFRMMTTCSYMHSGWFMPKFTAHFGAGVDFELYRCYQQEPQPQKCSHSSRDNIHISTLPPTGCFPPWKARGMQRSSLFLLVPFWGEEATSCCYTQWECASYMWWFIFHRII